MQLSQRQSRHRVRLRNVDPVLRPLTNHPLNTGLEAWWMSVFNRGGGFTAWDIVKGYKVSLLGFSGNAWSPSSFPGGETSVKYNGSTSYGVTDSFGFDYGHMTFACWVNALSLPSADNAIFDTSGSNQSGCPSFYAETPDNVVYGIAILTPGDWVLGANTVPSSLVATCTKGTWNHLVGTIDTTHSKAIGYINGKQTASSTFTGAVFGATQQPKNFGRRSTGAAFFNGYISSVKLWSRVLSPTEVFQEYALASKGYVGVLKRERRGIFPKAAVTPSVIRPYASYLQNSPIIGTGIF